MSEIIQRNKQYLVKSKYGSYLINSRKTAEQLQQTLTDYETINKQYKKTEQTLDKVTKTIIQLQLTTGILGEELETLRRQLK